MGKVLLGGVDIAILVVYLCFLVFIGLYLKKRASKNLEAYLLGGKSLPWYMLGLSNASGMFDISGTVWLVAVTVLYGIKSIYMPWVWPVFNQIFLMIYLSAWLRRSNCATGAEWIGFRFGKDKSASISHAIIVVFAIINCLGMLAYGFIGLGKFIELFLPLKVIFPFFAGIPDAYVPHIWGVAFTLFAVFYALLGGMMSIVWADVAQYAIMTIAAITIGIIAMLHISPDTFTNLLPEGWLSPGIGKLLDIHWQGALEEFNVTIDASIYRIFSFFFGMVLLKGFLTSVAGPAPTYDMQKILSTKNPREASLMSGFVTVVLMPVRYMLIAGVAVLGIVLFKDIMPDLRNASGVLDAELILPAVVKHPWIPVGLTGVVVAGLLAAFMSTFAGTLNASQAYIVNDIYIKYFNPKATPKQSANANYLVGLAIVIISIFFGIMAQNVDQILQWVTNALYGSYIAANILKWHWWRFNSNGFAWGMATGLLPALILPLVFANPSVVQSLQGNWILLKDPLYYFPIIFICSVIGCIVGTYSAPPTEEGALKNFYKKTRPWGFWGPVNAKVEAEDPAFKKNTNLFRDLTNILVGIVWQTCLVAAPIYLVCREFTYAGIGLMIIIVTSVVLYTNWYKKLENY
jgi:Na+/proline symporter